MKLLVPGLLVVALVGGIFSRWQKKEEPDLDQQVLDQLKKAGADLSKPHNIEFFLYFPTEDLANQAAKDVKGEGCDVKVQLGADKKNWLCFATKRMVPDHDELVRLRKRFNEIAHKRNGEYDGWGTEVEK
jgi:regulator of RNase E activity RraB